VAVDIAAAELHRSLARLAPEFPGVEMLGVVTDFSAGVSLEEDLDGRACTFFYPGSSIGNFTPREAVAFLGSIRAHVAKRPGSGLLIGVDGKKDKARLDAAYDDAIGVTAAFNRNVLRHLNRRFGFDFRVEGFGHAGFYAPESGRVEMHLESLRDQVVRLGEKSRTFPRGMRIHTESSYKYAPAEFEALLREAGFDSVRRWDAPLDAYYAFYAA
jgi:dimethylhistidine N-methyltransferase